MEEEVKEEPVKREIYWSASEVFTILSEKDFTKLVMPLIKAYYKHHYGNELTIHEHETIDVCMIIYVDRVSSKITFYHEPENFESVLEGEIKNDRQDLTPENIFDFIYYEYKQMFTGDPCMVEPESTKQEPKKKLKITL